MLIRTRVTTLIRDTLKDNDVVGEPASTKGFLPGFSWLQPAFVASKLGTRLSGGSGSGSGSGNTGKPAPGTHGNGLVSTEVNGVALQPGETSSNKVPLSGDSSFIVTFENQGENTRPTSRST